jgi:hypothetical protein
MKGHNESNVIDNSWENMEQQSDKFNIDFRDIFNYNERIELAKALKKKISNKSLTDVEIDQILGVHKDNNT